MRKAFRANSGAGFDSDRKRCGRQCGRIACIDDNVVISVGLQANRAGFVKLGDRVIEVMERKGCLRPDQQYEQQPRERGCGPSKVVSVYWHDYEQVRFDLRTNRQS
ncbi:MAG: hypothetical protein MI919_31620 [Holophagales bacterium]|nr:hypothetical protein [Holophagales bacterium]